MQSFSQKYFSSVIDYLHSFQGQEKDDEIKGNGNSVNYKYRMHDPRIGRFFAVDPLTAKYPHYSPYSFSGNRVIDAIELEGLEEHKLNDDQTIYGPYSNEYLDNYHEPFDFSFEGRLYDQYSLRPGHAYLNTTVSSTEVANMDRIHVVQVVFQTSMDVAVAYPDESTHSNFENGFYKGNYLITIDGQTYGAFIDANKGSYTVEVWGQALNGEGPYIWPSVVYGSLNDDGSEYSVDFHDEPNAQQYSQNLEFVTLFVATNYKNSGKDLVFAQFNWGYTNNGQTPTHEPNTINLNESNQVAPLVIDIINHFWPSYQFYGNTGSTSSESNGTQIGPLQEDGSF